MTHQDLMKDIAEHPEQHYHRDLDALQRCCFINGAIDLAAMDAHPSQGSNGGQKCDVAEGPCSCGAWH